LPKSAALDETGLLVVILLTRIRTILYHPSQRYLLSKGFPQLPFHPRGVLCIYSFSFWSNILHAHIRASHASLRQSHSFARRASSPSWFCSQYFRSGRLRCRVHSALAFTCASCRCSAPRSSGPRCPAAPPRRRRPRRADPRPRFGSAGWRLARSATWRS